jgi:hypothetical protein
MIIARISSRGFSSARDGSTTSVTEVARHSLGVLNMQHEVHCTRIIFAALMIISLGFFGPKEYGWAPSNAVGLD